MNWATRQGFGPLISHGISMGGHMAALAATSWTKPICLVPCLASTSASVTFCQVHSWSTGGQGLSSIWIELEHSQDRVEAQLGQSQNTRIELEYSQNRVRAHLGQSSSTVRIELKHSQDRVGAQLGQSWSTVRIELEHSQEQKIY